MSGAAPRARILIVEDEPGIRANLARFLKLEGFEVLQAADGREGLALAQAHAPTLALVLCDVMMPGLSGFEVLDALHQDEATRVLPLLFVSASAEPERLDEAVARGACGYVTKPYSFPELIVQVRRHLRAV